MSQKKGPRVFACNFKKEFAADIESGKKTQTIRARRADNKVPRHGEIFRGYTGLRTSGARLLVESVVLDCFPIQMDLNEPPSIVAAGVKLSTAEWNALAIKDGFLNAQAMISWFRANQGFEFEGFCVVWKAP